MQQIDNTMAYATQTLANHMASMATQIGILQQKVDELNQANQILKNQLKTKEGKSNDIAKHNIDNEQANGLSKSALPETK